MTETVATATPAVEDTKEEIVSSLPPPPPALPSEYYAMVVDSGPIIKHDVRNLMGKAQTYVTTPSVMREIRDSKARDHLENAILPLLDLKVRDPSDASIQQVIAFAKQTGDYASLSTVDLQVLALTLDLEKEGNRVLGNDSLHEHIRTTPKRKIGLGSILPMNGKSKNNNDKSMPAVEEEKKGEDGDQEAKSEEKPQLLGREDYDEVEDSDDEEGEDGSDSEENDLSTGQPQEQDSTQQPEQPADTTAASPPSAEPIVPVKKSWATLVDPTAASTITLTEEPKAWGLSFGAMSLKSKTKEVDGTDDDAGGMFDDASEDDDEEVTPEEELQMEFPSLLAASTVPYEGEDDEIAAAAAAAATTNGDNDAPNEEGDSKKIVDQNPHHKTRASVFMTEEEKQQNLKQISKSGRSYNSFRKYKGLMKPKQPKKKPNPVEEDEKAEEETSTLPVANSTESTQQHASRFLGGGGGGETMREEDDDGQGWITSSEDIKLIKNETGGILDPGKMGGVNNDNQNKNSQTNKASGPHMSQRTACATTDFAMQNVLLQMNMILMSTEGMRIRRLKSWVIRCGACFKIHGADEDFHDDTNHHMKRLFCSHCGSGDMMQRISASVDGKTGRLKLHFSRRKQGRHHSIRGTKFSLPKPGSGNKYKGDLLLREDQLLSGAWNQKVKINSGRKHQTAKSHSMFGRDIASSVGCNVRSTSSATFGGKGWASTANTTSGGFGSNADDIRIGFGARKNPNAAKGRERRGKKKKSSDRACGMRRY